MREFWFERSGVRLCAVEDGNGRPVVMLHGGLANHWTSLGLVGSLSPRFRVVTPDLRGSGKSHDGSPLTWDRLADDVVALMDHIGVDRAVVGGVSSGAGAAVRFGLRHPRKVAGLVIVTPVYGGDELGLTAEQTAIFRQRPISLLRALSLSARHPSFVASSPRHCSCRATMPCIRPRSRSAMLPSSQAVRHCSSTAHAQKMIWRRRSENSVNGPPTGDGHLTGGHLK
jgi:pimeloyl-ACP methyl ester carboxylesterase